MEYFIFVTIMRDKFGLFNLSELAVLVNKKQKEGYVVTGSLFVNQRPEGIVGDMLCQPMVLKSLSVNL